MVEKETPENITCSFCGKRQEEVEKVVVGPEVYICDECIELCVDIIMEEFPPAEGGDSDSSG